MKKAFVLFLTICSAFAQEASVVGAIGVSGAPGGDRDDTCARAGIAAIKDSLDF